VDERQDSAEQPSRTRVSVQEAAEHLRTTVDAIRKRIQRDTIAHEKDAEGRVWILLDTDRTRHANGQDVAGQRQDSESGLLISEMRGRIEDLREQLKAERQAHSEARRLLAAALERIPPQLEAPQETRESSQTVEEEGERVEQQPRAPGPQESVQSPQSRSWWQRIIGGSADHISR
jgi:hypothetical protein